MLGKTANGLFWMFRDIERAENTARLVDVGLRMGVTWGSGSEEEWASILATAGATANFKRKHTDFSATNAIDFLLRDRDNPASVISSIEAARTSARLVRTAVTREVWETVNQCWMTTCDLLKSKIQETDLPEILSTIRQDGGLIRGALHGTMLRSDIYDFARIGTFVERADNTARILDVKYYVLLPSVSYIGSTLDNVQWESILRSVSAQQSYRWVYDAHYQPANIADFLILNGRMPRSLAFSYSQINSHLSFLATEYGEKHACHDTANRNLARLGGKVVADIFEEGLHEFLQDFILDNSRLSDEIAEAYLFNPGS